MIRFGRQKKTAVLAGAGIAVCALILTFSLGGLALDNSARAREEGDLSALASQVRAAASEPLSSPAESLPESLPVLSSAAPAALPAPPPILPEYRELREKNHDLAGWVRIDGTAVDYPVMFTPSDSEYYLHRDFEKKDSVSGLPFVDGGCLLAGNNLLIHGHSMRNGTQFAALLSYAERSFWEKHPRIAFDTLTERGIYEVVGAFRSRVYYQDETGVFRYYRFKGSSDPEEFAEYVKNVKADSLYDTGVTAVFGDRLITLSTCAYHTENGRFAVVAKKVA